jgi:hypothetical protein
MKEKTKVFFISAVVLLAPNVGLARDSTDDIDIYRVGTYYGEGASYALQLDLDLAVAAATRVNVGGAYVHAKGNVDDLGSYQANVGVEHRIGNWGFALEGHYRDDDGVVTTAGARGRGYYSIDAASAGVSLGRSRIEVSYDLPPLLRQFVDDTQSTDSTEYGLDLRYSVGKLALYVNGTDFEYDEPLGSLAARIDRGRLPSDRFPLLQEQLANARARLGDVSFVTLRLVNNLLNYSMVVGADYRIGEHLINVELSREQVAVDEIMIDSVAVGWVVPIAATADMEMRIGTAQIQNADALTYGSLNFTFYR